MRELLIHNNRFQFIDILDVSARKCVGEHASFYIKGHIAKENDEYVLRHLEGQAIEFTAADEFGESKIIFGGLVDSIQIHTENDMRTLSVHAVSQTTLMDLDLETRTFQDSGMKYRSVTQILEQKHKGFSFLWPEQGDTPIGSMTVQYQETDWEFAKRLAARLGTVVVPDYTLGHPYLSIGLPGRKAKAPASPISYTICKDVKQYRDNSANGNSRFSERDAVYYCIKSREIYDLCDPIPFLGTMLYVYSIDTDYNGDELLHDYTLKERNGFFTPWAYNDTLTGAALHGKVRAVKEDVVQVEVEDDVAQSSYKWFPYATPFTQPAGFGWYFMPEVGDEIRLQFPSEKEYDAYASSGVHIIHGNRTDPKTKFIRTVYGQIIQFDPQKITIDDGSGSSITIDKSQGISMDTNKAITIDAGGNISMSANGRVIVNGDGGVVLSKNDSVININDAIDVVSTHTRMQ